MGPANPFEHLLGDPLLVGGVLGAVAVVALVFIVRRLMKGRRPAAEEAVDLHIDLEKLPADGPPTGGTQLQFYNVPARLAVVVMAPVGRAGDLPPTDLWGNVLDRLLPGLEQVVELHKPLLVPWPAQLSSHGFVQAFFNNVGLPGDRGRDTPWCSLAGRVLVGRKPFLLGIVCCADRPNGFSQLTADHVGDWLDVLRIRS